MSILPIKIYPEPILSKKGRKLTEEEIASPKIKKLILNMFETMAQNNGLGLAAPQIGESIQLCTINFNGEQYILVNPKITAASWRKEVCEEGCLSFPEMFIPVKRSESVKVKALNEKAEKIKLVASGLLARALQHEIDHLNGVLFTSHKVKMKKPKTLK